MFSSCVSLAIFKVKQLLPILSEHFFKVTLADIRKDQQSLAMGNPNRRRSSRVERLFGQIFPTVYQYSLFRIYYGSPSNIGKAREHEETSGSQFKHPLMVKENWKVKL